MRTVSAAFFLFACLLSASAADPAHAQVLEGNRGGAIRVALDLMDLEIPGDGSGDEMELPPIEGMEAREEGVERPPAEAPRRERTIPEAGGPVDSPAVGIVPFLLEEPEGERGGSRAGGTSGEEPASVTRPEEIPVELKTVAPPPSLAESLKLPAGSDPRDGGPSDVPEIPLLKGEDLGQRGPESSGQDPSLTMKPLPDLQGVPVGSGRGASLQPPRRPEDSLQAREEIDTRLIEIFERYYEDR